MAYERTITSNGHKYRQLVESKWDREKKQPRIHVIRHLGRIVERDGREVLVPAQTSFDTLDRSFPVGFIAMLWTTSQEFGMVDAISSITDRETAHSILAMVFNQLTGRKPLTKIGSWISESPIHRWIGISEFMTRDRLLSALDRISGDGGSIALSVQNALAERWRGIAGDDKPRFFFHDITRMRWNGDETYWAERGYGSAMGRPHIGFGLLVSGGNYFPVAGYPVRGSRPDKTTVREVVDNISRFRVGGVTFVWDRGFVSRENIDYALSHGYHVLSGGPHTSNEVDSIISILDDQEIERRENILELSDHAVYYSESVEELYGHRCRVAVMLDPERRNRERIERDLMIHALERAESKGEIAHLVSELRPIVRVSRGRRGYVIDVDEENRMRRMDGRSLFFCTNTRISGRDIIRTYFQKDRVEKAFRYLKGDASIAPVRYQLPGRVEAYLSVICFSAYLLIAAINWKIETNRLPISYEELVERASKIHEVTMTSKGKQIHRWTVIENDLEKLLKPFNIRSLET